MVQVVAAKSEQIEPTEAFDLLYGGAMGRLVDHLCALTVRLGGGRCELKTPAIVGRALVFRVARVAGWTDVDTGGAAAIRPIIRAHTGAIFTSTRGDIAP